MAENTAKGAGSKDTRTITFKNDEHKDFYCRTKVASALPVNPVVPDTLLNTLLSFCFRMWWTTMTARECLSAKSLMREMSP